MKKISVTILIMFLQTALPFSVHPAHAECLPAEITDMFPLKEDAGDLTIMAMEGTDPAQVDHVKNIYNKILEKDDAADGKLRDAINAQKPAVLIVDAGVDFDDSDAKYSQAISHCPVQVFQKSEIIAPGSIAAEHNVKDSTVEETINLVYQFGIIKGNPGWVKRLKKASSQAIDKGSFNPQIADPEQPKEYWPLTYLVLGLEVYYGFWADQDSVKDGGYAYKSRETLEQGDPELFKLIEELFPADIRLE